MVPSAKIPRLDCPKNSGIFGPVKKSQKQATGTKSRLKRVGRGLYRDEASKKYYARTERGGKELLHCLETTDRMTRRGQANSLAAEPEPTCATCMFLTLIPQPR